MKGSRSFPRTPSCTRTELRPKLGGIGSGVRGSADVSDHENHVTQAPSWPLWPVTPIPGGGGGMTPIFQCGQVFISIRPSPFIPSPSKQT